jgi:microcystin degradation protein MlrC
MFETGYKAAKLLFRTIRGEIQPTSGWRKIPIIVPAEKMLTGVEGPFARLFERVRDIEAHEGIVSASLFSVQPWLDVTELGSAAVVLTDGNPVLAQQKADQLARALWSSRHDLVIHKWPLKEALKKAFASRASTVVLVDGSDATVGGAPGDSTIVLQALLETEITQPVFLPILDPEAVEGAYRAGLGNQITLPVGGKRDHIFSKPVTVEGTVMRLLDRKATIEGPVMQGVEIDMGRTAVLDVGLISIVLTERNYPGHDPSLYRAAGLDPERAKIVVAKSAAHYRSNYAAITSESILADTVGMCTSNFTLLPYKRAPRPLFPLDRTFVPDLGGTTEEGST